MTVEKTLELAADILDTTGWCQNRGYHDGKRCVSSAIGAAAIELTSGERWADFQGMAYTVMLHTVRDAHKAVYRVTGDELAAWNDTPGRTVEEVVATLRKAAARARIPATHHR